MAGGRSVLFVVGLLVYWPSWLGCEALQAARGTIRIARGRRSSASRVPSGSRDGGKSSNRRGGGSSSSSDRSFDASSSGGGNSGTRKSTHKIKRSYSRGSMSVMARMRRKVGLVMLDHVTVFAFVISKSQLIAQPPRPQSAISPHLTCMYGYM